MDDDNIKKSLGHNNLDHDSDWGKGGYTLSAEDVMRSVGTIFW